eukprot:TRINITY_DN472_c0_g1_i4.p1 TRINITY_DN472_c0_g1~~TRINITY_DN472_c0_g1_i4.p1  ORF type:complete len:267 (-),score=33.83 TRINITY_DN472_c0_g1_i4:142-942(-)
MIPTKIVLIITSLIQAGLCQECVSLQQLLEQQESLSLMGKAIGATQLDIKEFGLNVTMLFPSSAALQVVLSQYGISDISKTKDPFVLFGLRELLTYHIVPFPFTVDELQNGLFLPTALEPDSPVCGDDVLDTNLLVNISDGDVKFIDDKQVNDEAGVIYGDLEVCEGIVHIIDTVLNPCCADASYNCDATSGEPFICISHLQCQPGDYCSANPGDGCKSCEECLFNTDAIDSDCTSRCGPQFPLCEVDLMNNKKICCARAVFDFCN